MSLNPFQFQDQAIKMTETCSHLYVISEYNGSFSACLSQLSNFRNENGTTLKLHMQTTRTGNRKERHSVKDQYNLTMVVKLTAVASQAMCVHMHMICAKTTV